MITTKKYHKNKKAKYIAKMVAKTRKQFATKIVKPKKGKGSYERHKNKSITRLS